MHFVGANCVRPSGLQHTPSGDQWSPLQNNNSSNFCYIYHKFSKLPFAQTFFKKSLTKNLKSIIGQGLRPHTPDQRLKPLDSASFLKKAGQKLLFPPLLTDIILQMGGYFCRGDHWSPA